MFSFVVAASMGPGGSFYSASFRSLGWKCEAVFLLQAGHPASVHYWKQPHTPTLTRISRPLVRYASWGIHKLLLYRVYSVRKIVDCDLWRQRRICGVW